MDRKRFPERRADGTFCVDIDLAFSCEDPVAIASEIERWWLSDWMPKNERWNRVWNRGHATERRQVLLFADDFIGPPQVVYFDNSMLRLQLVGKNSAKWWRDWVASRIVPELRTQFPSVGEAIAISNCGHPGGNGA